MQIAQYMYLKKYKYLKIFEQLHIALVATILNWHFYNVITALTSFILTGYDINFGII